MQAVGGKAACASLTGLPKNLAALEQARVTVGRKLVKFKTDG
jgi:hypothetical protein